MLTWKEPLSDGGRPVLDYTVEKRDASKKAWLKVGTTESFSMEVPNLKPDNAYVLFCFAATDWPSHVTDIYTDSSLDGWA